MRQKNLIGDDETNIRLDALYTHLKYFASPKKSLIFNEQHIDAISQLEEKIPNVRSFLEYLKISIYSLMQKKKVHIPAQREHPF